MCPAGRMVWNSKYNFFKSHHFFSATFSHSSFSKHSYRDTKKFSPHRITFLLNPPLQHKNIWCLKRSLHRWLLVIHPMGTYTVYRQQRNMTSYQFFIKPFKPYLSILAWLANNVLFVTLFFRLGIKTYFPVTCKILYYLLITLSLILG